MTAGEALLAASADQVLPYCAHFDMCGGCALQHLDSATQLRLKEQRLRDTFDRLVGVAPERWLTAMASPPWGYRRRARLGVRYVRRKQRALVAVGNSILTITYYLLSDPAAAFTDLGPDWYDRLSPLRRKRQLIAELERLSGKKVLLQEAAA